MSLSQAEGEGHCLWVITDPEAINRISGYLADQPLYIADGHHRYESALTYQRQLLAGPSPVSAGKEPNFVMMTLVASVS